MVWVLVGASAVNLATASLPICLAPLITTDSWVETVYLDHVSHNPPDNCNWYDHEYKFSRRISQEVWSNGLHYGCPTFHFDGCATNWTPVHALPNCPTPSCLIQDPAKTFFVRPK